MQKKEETVYYFNGYMPIFMHIESGIGSFRYITSQLIVNGVCKHKEIVNCFGVSDISVNRWVKRYKESKELANFVSKKKSGNLKPTDEVKAQIQVKYSQGGSLREIADELLIKKNTIQKAILQNRTRLIGPAHIKRRVRKREKDSA